MNWLTIYKLFVIAVVALIIEAGVIAFTMWGDPLGGIQNWPMWGRFIFLFMWLWTIAVISVFVDWKNK